MSSILESPDIRAFRATGVMSSILARKCPFGRDFGICTGRMGIVGASHLHPASLGFMVQDVRIPWFNLPFRHLRDPREFSLFVLYKRCYDVVT